MKKIFVVINEQHKLLPAQEEEISRVFGEDIELEFVKIPADGLKIHEMDSMVEEWLFNGSTILFVSPIPYMIREYAERRILGSRSSKKIFLFHNDKREKSELPDGRVIYKIAQDGWKIV